MMIFVTFIRDPTEVTPCGFGALSTARLTYCVAVPLDLRFKESTNVVVWELCVLFTERKMYLLFNCAIINIGMQEVMKGKLWRSKGGTGEGMVRWRRMAAVKCKECRKVFNG